MSALSNDQFFKLFFGALYEKGLKFIQVLNDKRHEAFTACLEYMKENDQTDDHLFCFIPSPFTGRYRELDGALCNQAGGMTQPQMNGWQVTGFELCSRPGVVEELNSLSEPLKKLILGAAAVFCQKLMAS